MARIIALLPHPAAAERLRAAMAPDCTRAGGAELAFARSWGDLLCQARVQPPDLVVFDPDAAPDGVERCEELHKHQPSVALLPYGKFEGGRARILLRLSAVGVHDVVIRGSDDQPPALRERVRSVLSSRFAAVVTARVGDLFPEPLHPLLAHLLANACTPLDPQRVGRSQFCHPKTLRVRLRHAGLPSLNRLIVWTRLFFAAHLLADGRRSPEQVARDIGYPSAAAFRAQVQRYAGIHVRELRTAHGLDRLLERFRARCAGPLATAARRAA